MKVPDRVGFENQSEFAAGVAGRVLGDVIEPPVEKVDHGSPRIPLAVVHIANQDYFVSGHLFEESAVDVDVHAFVDDL